MKTCTRCKETKELSAFSKGVGRGGYIAACKECRNAKRRETGRKDNCPVKAREYRLKKTYGLKEEEYQEMHKQAGGCCEICGTQEEEVTKGRLCVDHNHKTGEIRGLLCSSCNTGIGLLKDNPALLEAAAAYLETKGY
jgi:hypothetical protein